MYNGFAFFFGKDFPFFQGFDVQGGEEDDDVREGSEGNMESWLCQVNLGREEMVWGWVLCVGMHVIMWFEWHKFCGQLFHYP